MNNPRRLELTGKRFGRLTVVRKSDKLGKRGEVRWICKCDCGKTTNSLGAALRTGTARSCGCLRSELTAARFTTHGWARRPLFVIWRNMIKRCYDPRDPSFHNWGGRGIKVCDRWRNSYDNFEKDVGARPANQTLGRIDNNGDYEPSNCRWETRKQQANNMRTNDCLQFNGETLTLSQIADISGVPYKTLWRRLKVEKLSIKEATSLPLRWGYRG